MIPEPLAADGAPARTYRSGKRYPAVRRTLSCYTENADGVCGERCRAMRRTLTGPARDLSHSAAVARTGCTKHLGLRMCRAGDDDGMSLVCRPASEGSVPNPEPSPPPIAPQPGEPNPRLPGDPLPLPNPPVPEPPQPPDPFPSPSPPGPPPMPVPPGPPPGPLPDPDPSPYPPAPPVVVQQGIRPVARFKTGREAA